MIQIAPLKREEIPALLELYQDLVPFQNTTEQAIKTYEDMLQDKQYLLLAAKDGERLVGSALGICCRCLAFGGSQFLVIEDVIVRNDLRGQGIGRKLFDALDVFAKEHHCAYAMLVSSGFRKEAHQFYEKLGYVEDVRGFRKMYPGFTGPKEQ